MEATLVTVYIISLRFSIFKSTRVSSIRRRFMESARGSLHDMFLAAIVLSLGVLIAAALGRNRIPSSIAAVTTTSESTLQDTSNSVLLLVTTFCINPVLLLYILLGRGYRRRWLTRGITFISWTIWALSQTLRVFTSSAWRDRLGFTPGATIGELIQWDDRKHRYPGCTFGLQSGRGIPFLLWICFSVTLILPALYSVYILITSLMVLLGFGMKYGGTLRRPRWRVFERALSATTMLFSFLGMWISLGILLYIHVQTTGISWDLGQILALGTWIPVLFEFLYIFICKLLLSALIMPLVILLTFGQVGIPSVLEIRVPPEQIHTQEMEMVLIQSVEHQEANRLTAKPSSDAPSLSVSMWT